MTADAIGDALRRIAAREGVTAILHIGAGEGAALPDCLASGARRLWLIEPNPIAAAALRRATRGAAGVAVDPRAVAAEDGAATLRLFNAAGFSSLRRPTELRRLLPGLRTEAEIEVRTVSLATLLSEVPPEEEPGGEVLVIDAPGEEGGVLDGLGESGALRRFAHIVLRAGRVALYEGAETAAALRRRLEAEGFALELADETDPDRPCFVLRRDRAAAALEAARADLSAALRLQSLRESEIRDLRSRCDRLLEETAWQGELLDRIASRLEP